MSVCLNCDASEREKPLLALTYQDRELYICPQCLPVLIHNPAELAGKLPGAENFGPSLGQH
jgi:hypothetical protein